jgi:hypothetical protein
VDRHNTDPIMLSRQNPISHFHQKPSHVSSPNFIHLTRGLTLSAEIGAVQRPKHLRKRGSTDGWQLTVYPKHDSK